MSSNGVVLLSPVDTYVQTDSPPPSRNQSILSACGSLLGTGSFCRALRADGSEAFGVYIAPKAPFEPKRGNRVEQDTIDGHAIYWYRSEVAGRPNVETRETLVQLPDGRVAHIWLQASTPERLKEEIGAARGMRFQTERLSSN